MMKKKSIILSAAGLKNLILKQEDKNDIFTFSFGNKEIKLQNVYAEFISPIVSHFHQCDPTIKSIQYDDIFREIISTSIENRIKEIFEDEFTLSQLITISRGYSIEVTLHEETDNKLENLLYLSILLGNEELYSLIKDNMNQNTSKDENTKKEKLEKLEELEIYYKISKQFPMIKINQLIEEFSSILSNNDENLLKIIPKEIFYLILKSKNFKFEDTDTLIDIINDIYYNKDNENDNVNENYEKEYENSINFIYEQIDLSKVSSTKFYEILTRIEYDRISKELWDQLCETFRLNFQRTNNQSIKESKEGKEEQFEFDGDPSHRFEGIIHHLCLGREKNISDAGIIDVTSSLYHGNYPPKNVLDFNNNNYFKSNSSGGKAWLKYDFKDKKIRPTHYSIKTRNDSDDQNPRSWCIEVSNTNGDDDWRILDTRENIETVSRRNLSDTFEINTKLTTNESYRYIRFRHTNMTSGRCNDLAISSIEYFGSLIKIYDIYESNN